ncbi:MAG: ABC transporter permease subunit [Oscillospiraceae bacterium]|nr:ABC transporter permease subunit [Oscillospiraceae bacterium]
MTDIQSVAVNYKINEEDVQSAADNKTEIIHRVIKSPVNILFAVSSLALLLPDTTKDDSGFPLYTFVVLCAAEAVFIISGLFAGKKLSATISQITGIVISAIGLFTLLTAKFNILREEMFISPELVFRRLVSDSGRIGEDVLSSLSVMVRGYFPALVLGIALGLICGRSKAISAPITYVSAFLKQIPPIVYIPYAIALLPKYSMVSVAVIFIASFWPIFSCTFTGVSNVDKHHIDSAKVLKLSTFSTLVNVVLPASLPEIFIGCNQGLTYSFILLTSAEMIGGNSGIGYYIKYYSDFGDFTRIIVGIIVIGVMISVITLISGKIQERLLKWKR